MSTLELAVAKGLLEASAHDAWAIALDQALCICREPLDPFEAASEVQRRDAALGPLDLFLASVGWDLWRDYEASVPRTADALRQFWQRHTSGRAVLILDALSLRELPWLLTGAPKRGFVVHSVAATGSEIPGHTDSFARALGLQGRASLAANGTSASFMLPGATTETSDMPFDDCADLIGAQRDWVLWHEWPDSLVHELAKPGNGPARLATEAAERLTSDAFWELIDRLATGRRLVITSDHGYALSGRFTDVDRPQSEYLKARVHGQRLARMSDSTPGPWVPPLDLVMTTASGTHALVLGRRKWTVPGGHPQLAHGGLSILEVAVPFVELSKTKGA